MAILLLGLIVFFAPHAFTLARGNRAAIVGRIGEGPYRGLYSLVSLIGLALIIWGFGRYRAEGYIPIWDPPRWTRDVTIALMIPAMILLAAAYLPSGAIKGRAKHPMLAAVKIWALAHLLAKGDLGSMLLFAAFLAYAAVDRIAVGRRGEAAIVPAWSRNDWIAVVVGLAAFAIFAVYLHPLLIGVSALPS